MFDPKVAKALEELTAQLREKVPEIADELDGLTDEASAHEALARLMQLCRERPEINAEIARLAMGAFEGLRNPKPVAPQEEPQLPATAADYENALGVKVRPEDLLFKAPKSRFAQLDPMVEAAIAERAQFDGDVPELRFGQLPEGARPAIPVETTARNPVAIGRQLRQASEEIHDEARQLEFDHEQKLLAAGAEIDEHGNVKNLPAHYEGMPLTSIQAPDPERYKRGQKPAPIAVPTPTATELATLSNQDSKLAAYEALSTTQGRRSAVSVIRDLVLADLQRGGLDVETNDRPDMGLKDVPVYAEWTTTLSEGPNSTQHRFSFIDIAAKVLSKKLRDKLQGVTLNLPVLEVVPINTVDVRRVGWAARLVEGSR